VSRSAFRRHAIADMHTLLAAHAEQAPAADDVVDDEREGRMATDLPSVPAEVAMNPHGVARDEEIEEDLPLDPMEAKDLFELPEFNGWHEKVQPDDAPPLDVLVGELLLTYFEWMCVHKPTNECARAVHSMLVMLLPPGSSGMPEWSEVHKLLDVVYRNVVIEVDLCPNDHIAFVTATHPRLIAAGYNHGHRTFCPHPGCGAARYKLGDGSGRKVPVKKGYYFPLDSFVCSIFRDESTRPCREHTAGEFPSGHVRRSKGFYEKVTANPHMNKEARNQAFVGMADGIPLFRSIKTSLGVVVGAIRQANQPDHISKKFNKIHLSFLYPGEYWVTDPDTGVEIRQKAKPSNLSPMMQLLVDDLLHWYDGKQVLDYMYICMASIYYANILCLMLELCSHSYT
jgi:hypothetical protein